MMLKRALPMVVAGLIILSACAQNPPVATPTTAPTGAPTPTMAATAEPTLVPTPAPTPVPTVGPGGFPRRFHVQGNAFVDQFGQKMTFRGIDVDDPLFQSVRPDLFTSWDAKYYQEAASWGANIIRVPIEPGSIRNYGTGAMLIILDQTIAWARANKMYVILDFHSCGSIADGWYNDGDPLFTTTMDEFLWFWKTVSERYANDDTVAFYELFNEPANEEQPATNAMWLSWKGVAEKAIAAIRANDPKKVILVGGIFWAYDLSYVADSPIADGNVGYTTHPYPAQIYSDHKDWDTAFGSLSSKYPVFADEFGYDEEMGVHDIDVGTTPYHQAIIDYLEAHHMSWSVWVFDSYGYPRLILDQTTFQPSPEGEYFRSRLLALNGPVSP